MLLQHLVPTLREAKPKLEALKTHPAPSPPVRSLVSLSECDPKRWEKVAEHSTLPQAWKQLVRMAGPWMADEIAITLLEDPSLLQISVAYHLLCAATSVQLAALSSLLSTPANLSQHIHLIAQIALHQPGGGQ